jgi:hypothetical protein
MSKEVLLVVESVSNEKGVPANVILKRWSGSGHCYQKAF